MLLLSEAVETGRPFRHETMDRWYTWDNSAHCLRSIDGSRALIAITVWMAISYTWVVGTPFTEVDEHDF